MLKLKIFFTPKPYYLSHNSVFLKNKFKFWWSSLSIPFIYLSWPLSAYFSQWNSHRSLTWHATHADTSFRYTYIPGCILSTILTIYTPMNVIYNVVWTRKSFYTNLPENILLILQHIFSLHNNSIRFFYCHKSCFVLLNDLLFGLCNFNIPNKISFIYINHKIRIFTLTLSVYIYSYFCWKL